MIKEMTIRVLMFDAVEISESWTSLNNCSSFWRLYLNSRATASVLCGRTEHKISPGYFHLIPAWTQFSCRNIGVTGHFYVHFDLMGIPGALIRKYWPAPVKLSPRVFYPKVTQSLKMGQRGVLLARHMRVNELVYSALTELFESLPLQAMLEVEHLLQGHLRFANLVEHIESCLSQPLQNANLARICYMSEGHFVRSFSKAFGQPPAKYVQERRIAKASELLSFTDRSIEIVSQECGFSNRFHFSRVFKQTIGLAPGAYRLQKNNKNQANRNPETISTSPPIQNIV